MEAVQAACETPAGRKAERMLTFVRALSEDSRRPLTDLSRELGIPVSTLWHYLHIVRKHYAFTLAAKDTVGAAEVFLLQAQTVQPNHEHAEQAIEVRQ